MDGRCPAVASYPRPLPQRFPLRPPTTSVAASVSAGDGRSFVVAMVAVLGLLFASGVLTAGYTVVQRGGFDTTGAITRVAPAARSSASGPGIDAPGRAPGASPSVDPVFLGALRRRPAFAATGAGDLYVLGGATCAELDRGQGFIAVVADGGGRNLGPEDMGYLTGVSVMAYCPRHKPMLEQLIGRSLPSI